MVYKAIENATGEVVAIKHVSIPQRHLRPFLILVDRSRV